MRVNKFYIQHSSSKISQRVSCAKAVPSATEWGPLSISFIFRWGKIPWRDIKRDKEKGEMLTCLQAATKGPGINMRGWMKCYWEARAAHRCQHALCPRANGRVTLMRQGRGVYSSLRSTGAAVTMSTLSLPHLPSLFMCWINERTSSDGHKGRSGEWPCCKYVVLFFWWMCRYCNVSRTWSWYRQTWVHQLKNDSGWLSPQWGLLVGTNRTF